MDAVTKTCTKCTRELLVTHFNRSGQYLRSECRDCTRAASRAYGKDNRDRRNARLRKWRAANPEAARAKDRRARLIRTYGITEAQRDAMFAHMGGSCWVCRLRPATAIDHDHKTGRVRGAVCTGCNTVVLSRVDADPNFLHHLRAYLDQPCHADVLLELANREVQR